MATVSGFNQRVQDIGFEQKVPYKCKTDGTGDINQGSQLYQSTTFVLESGSDANNATFVGVAADNSNRNLYGTKQYPDSGTIQVYIAGIFSFNSVSGDTLSQNDIVYWNTDAQTVTKSAATNKIGIVMWRPGQTAITGAAGTLVDILIVPKWPGASGL